MDKSDYEKGDSILLILEILKEHTQTLTVTQISNILEVKHGLKIHIKTVKKQLLKLKKFGFDISFDIKENERYKNWKLNYNLSKGELRFCIDSIRSLYGIEQEKKQKICNYLQELNDKEFSKSAICKKLKDNTDLELNKEYFKNIEVIHNAIKAKRPIEFNMKIYNKEKKFKEVKDKETNEIKVYSIIPEDLRMKQGIYYVVGHFGNNKEHVFRIDKLTNVKMTYSLKAKLETKYINKDYENKEKSRPIMFSGEEENIRFKLEPDMVDKVVDSFFYTVKFEETKNGEIIANIKTNPKAFYIWAKMYLEYIEVLEPIDIRKQITNILEETIKKYKK